MFSLESDEMTALWPNDSLTFTFYFILSLFFSCDVFFKVIRFCCHFFQLFYQSDLFQIFSQCSTVKLWCIVEIYLKKVFTINWKNDIFKSPKMFPDHIGPKNITRSQNFPDWPNICFAGYYTTLPGITRLKRANCESLCLSVCLSVTKQVFELLTQLKMPQSGLSSMQEYALAG